MDERSNRSPPDSLSEGKLADIIVVDGNPLDDITILEDERNISTVIKEGEIIEDSLRMSCYPFSGSLGTASGSIPYKSLNVGNLRSAGIGWWNLISARY